VHGSPSMSSARPRHLLTPAVTKVLTGERLGRATFQDQAAIKGFSNWSDTLMELGRHDSIMGTIASQAVRF
jgi:hypothetical protein